MVQVDRDVVGHVENDDVRGFFRRHGLSIIVMGMFSKSTMAMVEVPSFSISKTVSVNWLYFGILLIHVYPMQVAFLN